MKRLWKYALVLGVLVAGGVAAYPRAQEYLKERSRPHFRTAKVTRGRVISEIVATGTIKPVLEVRIGAFVSGPVDELNVEFNDRVKKDQILAKIDPRIYDAAVRRDKATLATAEAEVKRVQALLKQAENNEQRSIALREMNVNYLSEADYDSAHFNRLALEAQLAVAHAAVEQAKANLSNSEANLGYTFIRSPVDGIVINRLIDPGQTLAAQFQTPEMFVVAPNLDERIHIYASVDEADIGRIRDAKERGQPVRFEVDAYVGEEFEGHVVQIRFNSTTESNVVTYPVIVEAPNQDLKLLPGMTADLYFRLDEHQDVLRIPSAASHYLPQEEHVRPEDRSLLRGEEDEDKESGDSDEGDSDEEEEKDEKRNANEIEWHVWVREGDLLRAIPIVTGLLDMESRQYELISGDLEEGQELVTGEGQPGS